MERNIAKMDYDELVKLDGETLTLVELEELHDHRLVAWFENLRLLPEHDVWNVRIEMENEPDLYARINIFVKKFTKVKFN